MVGWTLLPHHSGTCLTDIKGIIVRRYILVRRSKLMEGQSLSIICCFDVNDAPACLRPSKPVYVQRAGIDSGDTLSLNTDVLVRSTFVVTAKFLL